MTSDRPISPQLVRQHISGCDKRWEEQEKRTRELEKSMTEAALRMENGTHAFADLRAQQNATETGFAEKVAELTPKPPSVLKVVSIVLAIISMSAGALWGLSSMLNNRPTTVQIEKIMNGHQSNGHKETRAELRGLRDVQIEQGTKLDVMSKSVDSQGAKMDKLILQTAPVPDPPRNRNR